MVTRPTASAIFISLLVLLLGLGRASLHTQQTDQPPPSTTTTGFVSNLTRIESWNYFEPRPTGGDPTYAFIGNRLRFGVRHVAPRFEFLAAGQYVQFGGLPTGAAGPGPYGTGALYFGHSRDTSSNQVYLRYLNLRLKDLAPGLRIDLGRMGYAGGMESPSGNAKIEAVKNLRVASRLIGEFEWSIYQRGYDGVRIDYTQPAWHATAVASHPTQGGFEEASGISIDDIDLLAGSLTMKPDATIPHTDTQIFYYRYNDRREVRARVDNAGLPAERVDIQIDTFGATVVSGYPQESGILDTLLWVVGQTGSWYGQTHRGLAIAAEGGYQWNDVAWRPWIRFGAFRGSGDDDPADDRHETFFQILPTVRKYSLTASYNLMNSTDFFVQAILRPRPPLGLRIDLHRIRLTESADRWYFGSGATQKRGTIFGYGARPSNGATDFGTVIEGAASCTVNPRWSVNGYLGVIRGGKVMQGSFAGDNLTYGYFENVVSF